MDGYFISWTGAFLLISLPTRRRVFLSLYFVSKIHFKKYLSLFRYIRGNRKVSLSYLDTFGSHFNTFKYTFKITCYFHVTF